MTVSTTINKESFDGDGVTVAYPFTFKALEETDIKVIVRSALGVETTLTKDTHYTVAVNATVGGTVTLIGTYAASPPASGETVVVYRDVPYTQEINLVENDPQYAEVLEEGYDRAVILIQQLKDLLSRAPLLPITAGVANLALPEPDASKYLRWNVAGDALENVGLLSADLPVDEDVAKFLETPSSANFAAAVTDETGSGALVFSTSPTLVTPTIGAASGTSLTLSGLTASLPVFTDGSKNLVSKSVADTLTALGIGSANSPTFDGLTIVNAIELSDNGDPPSKPGIYSKGSSDGPMAIAIKSAQPVETLISFTPSHKLKIWINSVEYWIQLDAV